MKKLLLFLLIFNISLAQQTHVEVRLLSPNVGTPHCDYFFNDWLCNSTNDSGLNTILSNNGVYYFRVVEGHPYGQYMGRIFNISYSNNDSQLVADLAAYSSVIEHAVLTSSQGFSDALYVELANASIGVPTGTSGNTIITNDSGLNQIFQTFNVFQFSTYLSSANYYSLVCNCDAVALKSALDTYTSVIESTSYIQGAILGNGQFEKPKTTISPNPFSDNLNIETNQTITNYTLFDITGKTLIATSDKTILNNLSSQLSSGIYLLNLTFDNGQKTNFKLVKK